MKSFKSYISEEVLPTAEVQDGSIDIEKPQVRAQINNTLVAVTAQPAVTPYVVLQRIMKALAYFHIILPKKTYMGGDRGVEVYEVHQFGHRMGMTNDGEFVSHVPEKFYLFVHYSTLSPMGVTYARPVVGGMYKVDARLVDADGLEKMLTLAQAHQALQESNCGCDDKATASQRMAGREEMHDVDDEGSPSTKKAVDTSEKGGKVKQVNEVSLGKLVRYKNEREKDVKATNISASHSERESAGHKATGDKKKHKEWSDEAKWLRGKQDKMKAGIALADKKMKGKAKVNASMPKHPYMEETDAADETNMAKTQLKAIGAKSSNLASMMKNPKNLPAWVQSKLSVAKDGITSVDDYMTHSDKKLDEKLTKRMSAADVIKDFVHSNDPKFKGKSKKERMKMALGAFYGMHPEKSKNIEEGMTPVKKTYAMKKLKTKASTVVKRGLGVGKDKTKTILVTTKGDPHAAAGGGVRRIPKDKYDPTKHNMASE